MPTAEFDNQTSSISIFDGLLYIWFKDLHVKNVYGQLESFDEWQGYFWSQKPLSLVNRVALPSFGEISGALFSQYTR